MPFDIIPNELPTLPNDLNFDPIREPAYRNGQRVEGKWWVINPLTDKVIGDGKRNHKPTNFNAMWENFRKGINLSDLDLSDTTVKFTKVGGGSAMRADIVFKKYDYKRILGEPMQLKMRVLDSHDQTFKRTADAMLLRLACLNGMPSISETIGFAQKHTLSQNPEKLAEISSKFPERIEKEVHIMKKMSNIPITIEKVKEFLSKTVASYKTVSGMKVNQRALDDAMRTYFSYKMNDNVYRLYNTLTHLSSHVEGKRDNTDINRKQLRLETDVENIVRSKDFAELMAA